jgi:hypothetical protein
MRYIRKIPNEFNMVDLMLLAAVIGILIVIAIPGLIK